MLPDLLRSTRWRKPYSLTAKQFAFVEVCELLLRYYKPEPARIRPTDRMVAHTGFLVFAGELNQVKTRVAKCYLKKSRHRSC